MGYIFTTQDLEFPLPESARAHAPFLPGNARAVEHIRAYACL